MIRYAVAFIIFIHGLIHLMGFAKAFGYGNITQLSKEISRPVGALWLLAAILFVVGALLYLLKKDSWVLFSACAVIVSQYLVFTSWHEARFGTLANVVIILAAVIAYGTWSFKRKYEKDVITSLKQTASISDSLLTEKDIQLLPEPVKRYLRYTGSVGKPKVKNFKIAFTGQIRKNAQSAWMPFASDQYNFPETSKRLFYMNASMMNLPVAGFHSFINGDAFMDIRLLSLIRVQYQSGKEMGIAETVTFFNDMCCMAPATLIDKRIQWQAVENNNVKAVFTNNDISISAWLYFNDKGELINFISDDRYAVGKNNTMKRIRWSTPLKNYVVLNGYKLAGYAEAVYAYPEGDLCYGTFRLTDIKYNVKDYN